MPPASAPTFTVPDVARAGVVLVSETATTDTVPSQNVP
jgi:hypothetical protein